MTDPYSEAMTFHVCDLGADYDPSEAYVVNAVEHLPV